jgi:hypothetical protein
MVKMIGRVAALGILVGLLGAPSAQASTRVSIQLGTPAPIVRPVAFGAARRGFIWQPGYRVRTRFGYRWVPGRWVRSRFAGDWRYRSWERDRRGFDDRDRRDGNDRGFSDRDRGNGRR